MAAAVDWYAYDSRGDSVEEFERKLALVGTDGKNIPKRPPFKKNPRQREAVELLKRHKHAMLYGGSRSGKSVVIDRQVCARAFAEPSRHLIARHRFNAVKTSIGMDTMPFVLASCFPNSNWELNKSDWVFYLETQCGGTSEIWLGGTDEKERLDKVLGKEYATVWLNEVSQLSWDAVGMMLTRLAQNTRLNNRMFYDCNPPSRRHWTYQLFVKGLTPELAKSDYDTGYLQLNPLHNIDNLPADYIDDLNMLPRRQRERFLKGEFLLDVEGALWTDDMVNYALGRP